MSIRPKTVCDSCSATYILVHELPEDNYTEQYCPFCGEEHEDIDCLLYTSPSPRDGLLSRMPSSA